MCTVNDTDLCFAICRFYQAPRTTFRTLFISISNHEFLVLMSVYTGRSVCTLVHALSLSLLPLSGRGPGGSTNIKMCEWLLQLRGPEVCSQVPLSQLTLLCGQT